ncbi:hypothetical protein, partial [Escherichia coli]|uniref:hypothetical protein n=1 Tax=Escherichia coli TaxID=562 RepID=UPI0019D6AB4E
HTTPGRLLGGNRGQSTRLDRCYFVDPGPPRLARRITVNQGIQCAGNVLAGAALWSYGIAKGLEMAILASCLP